MIISVASGKGGTGKTTVATNLAFSLGASEGSHLPKTNDGVQFLDCDVEEPNAYLFLNPKISKTESVGIFFPVVDEEKCNYCGKCAEVCAYNAIAVVKDKVLIFPELCHGCGGCSLLCPQKAISEANKPIGVIEQGKAKQIEFAHGILNIGEALHTPVVRAVKKKINNSKTVIIDVAPGTSCPVIEAVKDTNFCILVTEPTPFGLNDLILAVGMLKKIEVPFGVIVNRADVGDKKVEKYCKREKIPILMRIPMDREIAVAYSNGIPFILWKKEWKQRFKDLYYQIEKFNHR